MAIARMSCSTSWSSSRRAAAWACAASFAAAALLGCSDAGGDATSGGGGSSGVLTGSSGAGLAQPAPVDVLRPAFVRVVLEIDHADGAAPYTGPTLSQGEAFGIFERNARAFFGEDKILVIPKTLDEMTPIGGLRPGPYTADQILEVAAAHRSVPNTPDTASFHVVFLDGIYRDSKGDRPEVLGLSIGATGVIAMFKPVIERAGAGFLPDTKALLEQAVLVHEFGHAAGLVDNGLPMASPHRDEQHGRHCENDRCVMYYALESGDDPVGFVLDLALGGEVLFGPECLADARAAKRL